MFEGRYTDDEEDYSFMSNIIKKTTKDIVKQGIRKYEKSKKPKKEKYDNSFMSDIIKKTTKDIVKQGIHKYEKSKKPKKTDGSYEDNFVSQIRSHYNKTIDDTRTKKEQKETEKSEPVKTKKKKVVKKVVKKEKKEYTSPWMKHVEKYMNEHNVSWDVAMADAKSTYDKTEPSNSLFKKNQKVIVVNGELTWLQHLNLIGKKNAGNTWFKTRDTSGALKNKIIRKISSMKGLINRHCVRAEKSKDEKIREESKAICEYAKFELERLTDIYKRGKDVGFKASGSDPSRPRPDADPDKPKKEKKIKPKVDVLSLIKNEYKGSINLTKDNIISKEIKGNSIDIKVKDVIADGDKDIKIIKIQLDPSNIGFNVKMIGKKDGKLTFTKPYFVYIDMNDLDL